MTIYDELLEETKAILAEFGQGTVTYAAPVAGAAAYDAVTYGTPVTVDAAVSGVTSQFQSALVSTSDLMVIFPGDAATPTTAGKLTIDGVPRTIISVQPIPAAGTVVAWRVFVKGA